MLKHNLPRCWRNVSFWRRRPRGRGPGTGTWSPGSSPGPRSSSASTTSIRPSNKLASRRGARPSTPRTWPVTYEARSEARNAITSATSSGRPKRRKPDWRMAECCASRGSRNNWPPPGSPTAIHHSCTRTRLLDMFDCYLTLAAAIGHHPTLSLLAPMLAALLDPATPGLPVPIW